ncbi:hypothetical protein D7U93_17065 [Stenotrophomonas maltophilia]|nr:hypothetical protein [Stenotrophomonas maltophilia]MRE89117.1 hypothetical protein [Stenotrophomonas sp. M37]MRF20750.1 hypothetical protein [Stenotrophomonas sp. MY18]MBA0381161.1 hypothetical protein [Stenotrophomonas maltophilia]MBA0409757.1 hypothetical protein [Stenotrophomonas maltophilia]
MLVRSSFWLHRNAFGHSRPTLANHPGQDAGADHRWPAVQARLQCGRTLTAEGYGAIEFLDAQGKVIHTLAPEAELRR